MKAVTPHKTTRRGRIVAGLCQFNNSHMKDETLQSKGAAPNLGTRDKIDGSMNRLAFFNVCGLGIAQYMHNCACMQLNRIRLFSREVSVKAVIRSLGQWCAYSHMFKVFKVLLSGGDVSSQTKAGRNIALLGIFCPFFWIALFNGASKSELAFHATHSGIVFFIGIAIMFVGLKRQKER